MLQDDNGAAAQSHGDTEDLVGLFRTEEVFDYTEIISVEAGGKSIHPPAC